MVSVSVSIITWSCQIYFGGLQDTSIFPPWRPEPPTLRLWTRRASVLHFRVFFFFFATTSFSRLQEISRASLGVLAAAEFVLCTRSPLPRGLFNGRHFQADSLARTPLKGLLPGVKRPMLSLLHGLRKRHLVESAFPMDISFTA